MIITKKIEDELLALLRVHSISIPELQKNINLSYREACSLIDYALKRRWLTPCMEGNQFPTNSAAFSQKSLTPEQCRKIYDVISFDGLKVLYYYEKVTCATFEDIILNVDDDNDDMHNAIDELISANILFECDGHYYCNISAENIEKIKNSKKDESEMPTFLRRRLGNL